jgi:hypothetical protein
MTADTISASSDPQEISGTSQRRLALYKHTQSNERFPGKEEGRAVPPDGWLACFIACELLARSRRPPLSEQSWLPSGARIFYYTTLAIHRQELPGSTSRSSGVVSWEMTDSFLATAVKVATGLERYYAAGVQLRRDPLIEGARLLCLGEEHWRPTDLQQAPNESQKPALHGCVVATTSPPLVAYKPLLATLVNQFFAERLPISPVAHPQDALPVALRLLKKQLAQEAARMRQAPSGEVYLYEEPLHTWLGRLVQAHRWIGTILRGPQH